jgi:hypothetical protein
MLKEENFERIYIKEGGELIYMRACMHVNWL